jgi:hypothetical protein
MAACHIAPKQKKKLIGDVGETLVKRFGKRTYYEPRDVRRAAEICGYEIDVHCWAYVIFTSADDFQALHEAAGEVCDYVQMKTEILTDLAAGASFLPIDIDLSWLSWPDIDLSSVFDWFDAK